MNLLCPNCQKMLTVPEQYAGQLMKCPLCGGTFTVPALPQSPVSAPETPAFNAPPPPTAPPLPPLSSPPPDIYGVKEDPEPPVPAFHSPAAEPTPAFTPAGPPPPPVTSPAITTSPEPSVSPPAGYTRTITIWFSDRVLQWVPAVALFLVFIFQFFPWVGVYPGGVPAATQTAWGAAFGSVTEDPDMKPVLRENGLLRTEEELTKANRRRGENEKFPDTRPGVSPLLLIYILVLFFPTLLVTIACVVIPLLHNVKLPPFVEQVWPWRWGIVAALNAVLLLFLVLQLFLNFSIENKVKAGIEAEMGQAKESASTPELKQREAKRGGKMEMLVRTFWLKLSVFLHFLATVCAALVYWVQKRGPSEPLPRLELMW
jgi:hypothetical protein